MVSMEKRWTKVGSGLNPSKRELRRAEEVVKLVRENRLRHADPADRAKAEAIADELFGKEPDITFGPERDEPVTNDVTEAVLREHQEDLGNTPDE